MADLKISQLTGATTPLAGTEVLPIVQSGATRQVSVANLTAGRTQTSDGIIQGTAGTGYNFTANIPAAGMTSQLLNWYEEGTWTPSATAGSGSITSYTSSGSYTRIGRMVHIQATVTLTNAGTGSGALFISLPFSSGAYGLAVGAVRENGLTGNLAQVYANGSSANATVFTAINSSIIATGAVIDLTLDYQV